MVHFELTDVIRTVKYCNFPSYIMKLQYLKCILTRFIFSKIDAEKTQFSYENYQSGTQWQSIFCLPHQPNSSDIFDLVLQGYIKL